MATILIVDDSTIEKKKLQTILAGHPHTLIFASTGEEGITAAYDNIPDLILMDFVMPDVDGIVATEYLKTNEATKKIPIIMITSSRKKENFTEALKSGINDFLLKPYTPEQLFEKIEYNLYKTQ
jgi:CheY-like chemotaxis protein